jgi:hypothetical protein
MNEKLFGYRDVEIWREGDRYFVIYDAGSHQVVLRRDEITPFEAESASRGAPHAIEMLVALQKRLEEQGIDPYVSNFER